MNEKRLLPEVLPAHEPLQDAPPRERARARLDRLRSRESEASERPPERPEP